MKKILILFFSILYIVVTTGFSINMHFCGDNLIELSINSSTKEENCCGKKEIKKGCCTDKNTTIKVADKHLIKHKSKLISKKVDTSKQNFCFAQITVPLHFDKKTERKENYSPPPPPKTPIYLKIEVLTI